MRGVSQEGLVARDQVMRDLAHLFDSALRRYRPAEAAAAAAVQAAQGNPNASGDDDRGNACVAQTPCACASAEPAVDAAALSIQRLRLPHMHTDIQVPGL